MFKSRLARFAAVLLVVTGMTLASPSVVSAEATGQYQYTCQQPGLQAWAMPAGTQLSMCVSGYVYVRINGNLVQVIPVNAAGAQNTRHIWTKSDVGCIVAVLGAVTSVLTITSGTGFVSAGLSLAGIAFCRA